MVKKVVASLVLTGALAAGSAALSAPASAAGRPAPSCSGAPAALARLQSAESALAARLAALEAQLAQSGTSRGAHGLRERIAQVTREQAELAAQVSRLLGRCPAAGGNGGIQIIA
ncbi:MAG TPA: hypothetical protein VMU09_13240 [Acidimicrobiales bacterium]|nr:hypothetical protein [Acidimicrobiales bacterium]